MKLLKKLSIIALVLAGFFFMKTYQPIVNIVYPDQCHFLLDEQFSDAFQQELKTFVAKQYQDTKDPQAIVRDVANIFSPVVTIDAYVCNSDKFCFSFDGAKPLFVLNGEQVVCDNYKVVDKRCYNHEIVGDLCAMTAISDRSANVLISLFQKLPKFVFQEFEIKVDRDDNVVLQAKKKSRDELFFSLKNIPTEEDIGFFKVIQNNSSQKVKTKKVYDFRFHNQIIIR